MALVDGIGFRLAAMSASDEEVAGEQKRVTADVQFYLKEIGRRRS